MKIGQIVFSKAGRDKQRFLVVTKITSSGVYVADGKERPLERPKLKNPKHLSETGYCLRENEYGSNRALRLSLNRFNATNNEF